FASSLPGYRLSSARLIAVTAVTCAGLSIVPLIVPFSTARAGAERRKRARSAKEQRAFTIVLRPWGSALVRRQIVQVNVQDQRGHCRWVDLVWLHVAGLRRARWNIPAPFGILLREQQLADLGVPSIPVLAAGLVCRLDGVVVVVVKVGRPAGPADRQLRQVVQRRRNAAVLGVAEQLQGQDAC